MSDSRISASELEHYQEHGYVIVPRLFDAEALPRPFVPIHEIRVADATRTHAEVLIR